MQKILSLALLVLLSPIIRSETVIVSDLFTNFGGWMLPDGREMDSSYCSGEQVLGGFPVWNNQTISKVFHLSNSYSHFSVTFQYLTIDFEEGSAFILYLNNIPYPENQGIRQNTFVSQSLCGDNAYDLKRRLVFEITLPEETNKINITIVPRNDAIYDFLAMNHLELIDYSMNYKLIIGLSVPFGVILIIIILICIRRKYKQRKSLDPQKKTPETVTENNNIQLENNRQNLTIINIQEINPDVKEEPLDDNIVKMDKMIAENQMICIICMSKKRNMLFYPCTHLCACYDCTLKITNSNKKCPVCRGNIEKMEQIFFI